MRTNDTQQPEEKLKTPSDISASDVQIFKPQQTVIAEGEKKECFFAVLQGTLDVFQNEKHIRILKEGDVFGLENFFLFRPYTTTVRSITDSRVAVYSTHLIKGIIYTKPEIAEKILNSICYQLEQTTQTAEENINHEGIVDFNEKVYEDGETILEEGDISSEFFRLLSTEDGLLITKKGKEFHKIYKPGEFVGEVSGLLKQPSPTTVTSSGKSILQVFSRENIDEIIESYPEVAKRIIDILIHIHSVSESSGVNAETASKKIRKSLPTDK